MAILTQSEQSNNAVMVNDGNQLTNPNVNDFLEANPEIASSSKLNLISSAVDSLETKTQHIFSNIDSTTISGKLKVSQIESSDLEVTSGKLKVSQIEASYLDVNSIEAQGNVTIKGILKANGIGDLIGKDLSVENLTVTDTLTVNKTEYEFPTDTILNVGGVNAKREIEANYWDETYPNKFVKGWYLARVESLSNNIKRIYISSKQYSYAEITQAQLPEDFETADFSNILVGDVFYFYNYRHFPYAFRVTSKGLNYLDVLEIDTGSLTIRDANLSAFRYGLFIIGTWDSTEEKVVFDTSKIDKGIVYLYYNALVIGDDSSIAFSSTALGTSNASIGMYSVGIGNSNKILSYCSTAFGQNNFVLGEKCSAIGSTNTIEGGNGNIAFGYNNRIYSSNVGTTISESSVALGKGISLDTTNVYPKVSLGQYNLDSDDIVFSIGNGTSDTNRSNAFEVYKTGGFSFPQLESLEELKFLKANSGALHFYNGYAQVASLSGEPIPNVNSVAFRWKIDRETYNKIDGGDRIWGHSSIYHLAKSSADYLQVYANDGTSANYLNINEDKYMNKIIDGQWHNVIVTCSTSLFSLYVDGIRLKYADRTIEEFKIPSNSFNVGWSLETNIGEVADFCFFNFDMSATNAPYTIKDYQNGRAIPPSTLDGTQTILALENYTINGKVLDYSGNKNHATITGNVKGNNDTRISAFVEEITKTTSEQN